MKLKLSEFAAPLKRSVMRLLVTFTMNLSRRLFVAVLFTGFAFVNSSAQNVSAVCSQIESAVTSQSPDWKLERKSRSCHRLAYFSWRLGKSYVYVFIWPEKTMAEAADTFKYLALEDEFYGHPIEVLGSGWRKAGEENRIWKTTFGSPGVDLRKGRVVVRVSASNMSLARQFAVYVADAIPDG